MELPAGFEFAGVACGIKESGKPDLALIKTTVPAVAAGVYTQNVVRATSIDWNQAITPSDNFRAIVINSGNANACTGEQGTRDNETMAVDVARLLTNEGGQIKYDQVLVLSTGVIGHLLPMPNVQKGIADATNQLATGTASFQDAAEAIRTTDKSAKTIGSTVESASRSYRISGMAKGAGMIGPNMATMLAVIMTDAKVSADVAQSVLANAANHSFNRISVEGHTSTNDAMILICSGESGVVIESEDDISDFEEHLTQACISLAKMIPSDGEGASHLVTIKISGAETEADADRVARTIAASALVKTAFTGNDPNWGRIVSAAGYSGVPVDVDATTLNINQHCVFRNGQPIEFDERMVSQSMADEFEIVVELTIGTGTASATHWTSDLTVDYVKFNSEYTT